MNRLGQVFDRYGDAVASDWMWIALSAAAAVVYVLVAYGIIPWRRWMTAVTGGLALVGSTAYVWKLKWLGDDAFISFRYARNWARGDGLVFNVGERVEGFTNFLWTMVLAGVDLIGLPIPQAALFLCMACFVGVLLITNYIARTHLCDDKPLVSLAAVGLAFNYFFACYGTSGLETMFSSLLVLAAVALALSGRVGLAGLAGIAATMSHPDHAIFYICLGLALVVARVPVRTLVRYAIPFFVVYVPYFLIRWSYFDSFFPNTYYAKAGGGSYFMKGGFYLYFNALVMGLVLAAPLFFYGLKHLKNRLLLAYVLMAFPVYLTYVAKIGGGYMIGRLFCAILPVAFLVTEVGARKLVSTGRLKTTLAALVLASAVMWPLKLLVPFEVRWYLTDERTFFQVRKLFPLDVWGSAPIRSDAIARAFKDADPPPVYAAYAIGYLGWITDWRLVDIHGLIDRELARKPLEKRGRPGHEREASAEHIFAKGATISSKAIHPEKWDELTRLQVGPQQVYRLVRYVPETMEPLRGLKTVRFKPFPRYLRWYVRTMKQRSREVVAEDLAFFDRYYFEVANDPEGRRPIEEYLARPATATDTETGTDTDSDTDTDTEKPPP